MEPLDDLNKKIIEYLKSDGRASFTEIAEKYKVSDSTIRKRVNKLIEDGTIERFTIILNPNRNGKSVISFLTIIPSQSDQAIKELARKIVKIPEVNECFYMSGKCGVLAKVVVKNLGELDSLLEKIRNLQGISEIESCIVLRELKCGV